VSNKNLFFIAIIPPEPYYQQALEFKNYFKENFQSRAALNSPPHLTLHMPFEWNVAKEDVLIEKLAVFCGQQNRVDLEFQDFGAFAPRVIFIDIVNSEPLRDLQKLLLGFCKRELNLFNANYRDLPFHPHVTVAFRDLKKPMFAQAWQEFKDKKFEGKFLATAITLLKHNGKSWYVFKQFELAESTRPA